MPFQQCQITPKLCRAKRSRWQSPAVHGNATRGAELRHVQVVLRRAWGWRISATDWQAQRDSLSSVMVTDEYLSVLSFLLLGFSILPLIQNCNGLGRIYFTQKTDVMMTIPMPRARGSSQY